MNARLLPIGSLLLVTAVAGAAAPASITSSDGFETEGDLALSFGYTAAGLTGTATVEVEDCGTFTYTTATSGSTSRVGSTTTWSLPLDLSACQAEAGGIVRTHHCDGYGNTFDTCEADGAYGADRTVTVSLQVVNRGGVAQCTTDVDGDGDAECDVIVGTLIANGAGVTEVYVPAPWWSLGADGGACLSRTRGDGERDPEGQGGTSCEDLGL